MQYITDNNVAIEINYAKDVPKGVRGYTTGNQIVIYASNKYLQISPDYIELMLNGRNVWIGKSAMEIRGTDGSLLFAMDDNYLNFRNWFTVSKTRGEIMLNNKLVYRQPSS